MTTTIKELKEFLAQFPEDTEVEVLEEEDIGNYHGAQAVEVPLNLEEYSGNWEFQDFTKNEFVKENHPYFGKKVLTLGEK